MIFLSISIAGTIDKHPAPWRKAIKVHCHPKSAIQHIMTTPRFPGTNQLLGRIACSIIISSDSRLELIHHHFSIVIAVDDAIGNVNQTIFSLDAAVISKRCIFRHIARRNSFAVPDFFSICFIQQIGIGIALRGIVQTNNIYSIAQQVIFYHLRCNVPSPCLIRSNQFDFAVIIRCVGFVIQPIPQIENPCFIRHIRFTLIGTDKVKFQTIYSMCCIQGFLVPAIPCIQAMLLAQLKGCCYPAWLSPPQQIQCKIWIDGFCIRSKLKACTTGYICRLVSRPLGSRFGSGRRIDIRTQLHFDMCQANAIVFLEQQAHHFFIFFWMFNLIIQQKSRGVVCRHTAESSITSGRIFIYLRAVRNNFHQWNITGFFRNSTDAFINEMQFAAHKYNLPLSISQLVLPVQVIPVESSLDLDGQSKI